MDLTPLYDLRERLKAGAIAGTGLIGEDFRLTRSLESLAQLEAASPVFAKLGQAVRLIFSIDGNERGTALIEALSLCDAILVTQGMGKVDGKIEPLPMTSGGSKVIHIPYSQLYPLLDALTGTGGGKYSHIMEIKEEHPEFFNHFRIRAEMVKALGAGYAELASKMEEWLSIQGADVIPLLKKDFDPKGKKEMVRRIHVLEAVAGKKENKFYLTLLDTAAGEVRAAAIYALRHEKDNGELLVNLAKTEKGISKKMAHWALVELETSITWNYFNELAIKKPQQACEYMENSFAKESSILVANMLHSLLDLFDNKDKIPSDFGVQLNKLLDVLPGKWGTAICDFYRRAAAYEKDLQDTFSETIPIILQRSIVFHPSSDLIALAEELYKQYGITYAVPAMMAVLLSKDADTVYQSMKPIIHPSSVLINKTKKEKIYRNVIESVLSNISWDNKEKKQVIQMYFYHTATETNYIIKRPLTESLHIQWYKDFIIKGKSYDNLLIKMIQPESKEICEIQSKYFYLMAKKVVDNLNYLTALKEMGWNQFEGMLYLFCVRKSKLSSWELREYAQMIPINNKEKANELEKYLKNIEEKKITITKGISSEIIGSFIDELRN